MYHSMGMLGSIISKYQSAVYSNEFCFLAQFWKPQQSSNFSIRVYASSLTIISIIFILFYSITNPPLILCGIVDYRVHKFQKHQYKKIYLSTKTKTKIIIKKIWCSERGPFPSFSKNTKSKLKYIHKNTKFDAHKTILK